MGYNLFASFFKISISQKTIQDRRKNEVQPQSLPRHLITEQNIKTCNNSCKNNSSNKRNNQNPLFADFWHDL